MLAIALIALALAPVPAFAQQGGIRVGVGADPDQVFFGGHLLVGPIADRVMFRPNLEAGLGDDLTTVALNFEFTYGFIRRPRPWQVYAGAGPALVVYSRSGGPRDGTTDTEPGFNLLVGLEHARGFFTEVTLGLIDSPEVKFVLGVSF